MLSSRILWPRSCNCFIGFIVLLTSRFFSWGEDSLGRFSKLIQLVDAGPSGGKDGDEDGTCAICDVITVGAGHFADQPMCSQYS